MTFLFVVIKRGIVKFCPPDRLKQEIWFTNGMYSIKISIPNSDSHWPMKDQSTDRDGPINTH